MSVRAFRFKKLEILWLPMTRLWGWYPVDRNGLLRWIFDIAYLRIVWYK